MNPYEVYMKPDKFATKWRVIIGADDTIKNGSRFYEGCKFKYKGENHYLVTMGTTTPTSRRYSMKNWSKVPSGSSFPYVASVMLCLAKYRAQPFLRSGKPYMVSEKRKMIDSCFVNACLRKHTSPNIGVVQSGNFNVVIHIMEHMRDFYEPEEYNEEAHCKQEERRKNRKKHF